MARNYSDELARLQISLEDEVCCVLKQSSRGSEFACADERDEMVTWLHQLTQELDFCHEVFFRSVVLLDSFLASVKVRHRYLRCVTGTCFLIAAKLEESQQPIDNLLEVLVDQYGCECTRRDVQHMELIVMQKLEFHLNRPTAQDFIKSFHSLSLSSGLVSLPNSLTVETHIQHLVLCLQLILCSSSFMHYRPSMLALAVLGCDLKILHCDWLTTLLKLQILANVQSGELSACYEAVAAEYPAIIERYPLHLKPTQARERDSTDDEKR